MQQSNTERVTSFIKALREISEPCECGVQRQSYSPEYRKGVDYARAQMNAAGLETYEDAVGNLFGVLRGTEPTLPAILSGSHLDTVRCAGAYDGITGVACALEAARMIKESGVPMRHTLLVLGTIGEEGTHFGQVLLGSRFLTGVLGQDDVDRIVGLENGETMREAMQNYGLSGDVTGCSIADKDIMAFLELHGEQGPVLEQTGTQIGIVDSIAGITQLEITVDGQTGHCGTVPMASRKDAGIAAYGMLTALHDYAVTNISGRGVITCGQLTLQPGSSNCIPGKCIFTLDIRSGEDDLRQEILSQVRAQEEILRQKGFGVNEQILSERGAVPMNEELKAIYERCCDARGYSHMRLNSGAGHDAMVLARCFPTAMLFLPNLDGISHHPAEFIPEESIAQGAEILYDTVRLLDQR